MKKTVKYVISVLAVVSLIMTSLVLVSFAASPKITMKTGETSNGQTEVIISVSKGSDLATFQAAVKYDTEKLKLMSVEYLAGDKNVSNTETEGVALVNDIWLESLNDEADIIRLVFSAPTDSKTKVSVEDIVATDSNDNPIEFKTVSTTIKVKASTPEPQTDPGATTTTAPAAGGSGSTDSGISGSTNGTSPNTGRMIASAAGICGAAAAAAAVVIVLKRKNDKAE